MKAQDLSTLVAGGAVGDGVGFARDGEYGSTMSTSNARLMQDGIFGVQTATRTASAC
jgi:hypothetical protein